MRVRINKTLDFAGYLLIGVFCVVGAFIAYGADLLGRNLGKKRLTIFGLRPKHTAALMTAIAGFLIPLLTAILLYAVSDDVRIWLKEGHQAVQERDRKVAELRAVQNDLSGLRKETDSQKASIAQLSSQRKSLSEQNARLEKARQTLRAESKQLNIQLTSLRSKLNGIQKTLKQAQMQLRLAKLDLKLSQSVRDEAVKQQNDAHRKLDAVNVELDKATKELDERAFRLTKLTEELKLLKEGNEKALELLNAGIRKAQSELGVARREVDEARNELDRLRREAAMLSPALLAGRTRPLIYSRGDELARMSLPAGASQAEVRTNLTTLLRSARVDANKRGAASPDGSDTVAGLTDLPLENGQELSVEEQEEEIFFKASGAQEAKALIAYAFWNSFKEEFVPLRIEVVNNPLIYKQGQLILETSIDGRKSQEFILEALGDFLQNRLTAKAIESGMIPATGREQRLGEITRERILALVAEIKSAGHLVRVQALASRETRAIDSLRLDFKVKS